MILETPPHLIKESIKGGRVTVAIIGLGYVGLHLVMHFVKAGANVIGVDVDQQKIDSLKGFVCPIQVRELTKKLNKVINNNCSFKVTTDTVEAVKKSDVCIVAVPTPVDKNRIPDLSYVEKACAQIGKGLKAGSLVILESMVPPGTTDNVVKPILEGASKLKAGKDFGLAYCLERIDPGNTKHRLDNIPKVLGGVDRRSADVAAAVYSVIVNAEIVKVKNCRTAELVKLVENIYRDLNIAFMNEIALVCEEIGVDVLEIIDSASTKWSFHPHFPGVGVGGHCLPNNPYYLLNAAKDKNARLKLVRLAREINERMPYHVVELIIEALNETGKTVKGARVTILGVAYKADIDDYRETPAKPIIAQLQRLGAHVTTYDPFVKFPLGFSNIKTARTLKEAIRNSDCVVVVTDHSAFKTLTPTHMAKYVKMPAAVVDGRNVFTPEEVEAAGMIYRGIGRTRDSRLNIWNLRFRRNSNSKPDNTA